MGNLPIFPGCSWENSSAVQLNKRPPTKPNKGGGRRSHLAASRGYFRGPSATEGDAVG